jgi:autoinducer 2-degrading protein
MSGLPSPIVLTEPGIVMTRVVLIVEYEIKPEFRQEFETLIRDHGRGTLDDEEGCLAFDVLVPRDVPDRIMLYECYADAAAYAKHTASPRLAATRARYEKMLAGRKIVVCDA